jgi:hypothetical protein
MRVLIGCEESQAVCKAFRALGHEAYSCDLQECSGGHPEWHLKMDVFEAIQKIKPHLGVFHPPCTYVAGSGVQWLSHPQDKHLAFELRRPHPKYPNRRNDMYASVEFVKALYKSDIPKIAIENPVGLLSSLFKRPCQIIQPYYFGDEATKTTCLWLKNLPLLQATNMVSKGDRIKFSSGKSHPSWYAAARGLSKQERQKLRSKTFPGIAKAMAEQWSRQDIIPIQQQLKLAI